MSPLDQRDCGDNELGRGPSTDEQVQASVARAAIVHDAKGDGAAMTGALRLAKALLPGADEDLVIYLAAIFTAAD